MNKKYIILSIVGSAILSISAICISLIRCEPITMDWMGVLVGVLSFLVTMLLGWQIFTLFDIRNIQKEVKINRREMALNAERRLAEAHCALWIFYQAQIEEEFENEEFILSACVQSGIASIYHFSICGEYHMAGQSSTKLACLLSTLPQVKMSQKLLQSQIQVLLSVENPNKIQGYGELLSVLYKLQQ